MSDSLEDHKGIFDSINFVDSSLFSLCFDVFGLRMIMDVIPLNGRIETHIGEPPELVCFEFRRISNLSFKFDKDVFPKPFLSDGSVAAAEIARFEFDKIRLASKGVTFHSERAEVYCDPVDVYDIQFNFDCGKLDFSFVDLEISGYNLQSLQ